MNTPMSMPQGPGVQGYHPEQEILKLRKRLADLFRMGAATPETLQQALMQIWQETERRRQSCLSEAEDHLRKYHALLSQAHAFSSISSIAYSVINGYVQLEERRIQELADRERERQQNEADQKAQAAPAPTNGVQAHEGATEAVVGSPEVALKPKPSGGKRKKP